MRAAERVGRLFYRPIRGPQKVVKYCKNKKESKKHTKTRKKNNWGRKGISVGRGTGM